MKRNEKRIKIRYYKKNQTQRETSREEKRTQNFKTERKQMTK